ncbi:MAG: alpha/beta fold hydrolase [Actinocatenispora sp.]
MSITDPDAWVRRFHPSPDAAVRLICLPHAGGSAPFFFPVSAALSPGIEVLAVQYPGRQDRRREPLIDSIAALSDATYEAVLPHTDRPFALFGHSMGATVAFELGRRLEAEGRQPVHVFASGRRAPSRQLFETVHQRDDEGIIADLRTLSGTDQRIFGDDEIMRSVLPAIRNDYKAAETYRFEPGGGTLHCPVSVLVGDDDPKVDLDAANAWQDHTTGECTVTVYPGGHFYLVEHAPAVLALISDRLGAPTPA